MDWKDHPVVIAAISGAAGVAFSVQFLFPSLHADLSHDHKIEVEDLNSKVQFKSSELEKQKSANENLAAAKTECNT